MFESSFIYLFTFLFCSLMACEAKEFFSSSRRISWKVVGCENFSFVEVSYECVMVARLKQLDMLIVKAIRHGKEMPIYNIFS